MDLNYSLDLIRATYFQQQLNFIFRSRAVITDLVELLPLMSHNIALNNERLKGSCKAAVVSWGNQQQMSNVKETHFPTGVDFILLADCVYYEEVYNILNNFMYVTF